MVIMKIRKGMKHIIARVFLFFIALTILGGYGITRMMMKYFGSSVDGVASVNGRSVSLQSFQNVVHQEDERLKLIRHHYGKKADLYMKLMGINTDTRSAALQQIITEELVQQLGDSLAIVLADQYIEEKLANPHFIKNEIGHLLPSSVVSEDGKINVYALTQWMMTPEMQSIRFHLSEKIKNDFVSLIAQSVLYVPNFFSKDVYNMRHIAKKFSVQKFDISYFKQQIQKEPITKEELRNFYEKKSNDEKWYWIPEQRFGVAWKFDAQHFGIKISDAEIAEYYAKNKATRYVEKPAQFKVREIIFNQLAEKGTEGLLKYAETVYAQVLSNPETFAEKAKEFSQEKSSAQNGGLVDYFARGTKDKEYERAVVRLKNNGDISPIVKTSDGYAIIQRVDRKEPVFSTLENVKTLIEKSLMEQYFRRNFVREADKIIKEKNDEKLFEFIKKNHGSESKIGPVEKNSDDSFQRIFSIRNDGDYAIFIEDGKGIILKLTEKKAKHLPAFSTMIDQVTSDYKEEKTQELLSNAVKKAVLLAHKNGEIVEIEGTKIEKTSFINPEEKENLQKLLEEGYPNNFMNLTVPGEVTQEISKNKAVVVMLDELKKESLKDFEAKKLMAEGEAYPTIHNLFSRACLASLFRTATIKINKELIHGKDSLL